MTTFDKVYAAVRLIPRGSVATYGQIAEAIGNRRLARVVGYALHVNPEPGVIPCHRVVKRNGEVSSAFAFGGANRQVELLKAEGVGFLDGSHVDMTQFCVRALPLILRSDETGTLPFYDSLFSFSYPASVRMTSPAIISPAQPGTQTRLAGTLRRPGGGASSASGLAGSSGE